MKKMSENERLMISVILIILVFSFVNFLMPRILYGDDMIGHMRRMMNWGINPIYSLLIAVLVGLVFFVITREKEKESKNHIEVLEKVLSDDESKIISIVKETEGVTQDSLRFRTGFSKAKVSVIVTKLEEKGILQREKSGKTYKLYIGDWLK